MKRKLIAIACLILLALPVKVDAYVPMGRPASHISLPDTETSSVRHREPATPEELKMYAPFVVLYGIVVVGGLAYAAIVQSIWKPY